VSHDDRLRDQTDDEQAGQPQEQAKRANTRANHSQRSSDLS